MKYYPAGKEHFVIDHFSQAQQIGQVVHLRLGQTLVLNSHSLWTQGWAALAMQPLPGLSSWAAYLPSILHSVEAQMKKNSAARMEIMCFF